MKQLLPFGSRIGPERRRLLLEEFCTRSKLEKDIFGFNIDVAGRCCQCHSLTHHAWTVKSVLTLAVPQADIGQTLGAQLTAQEKIYANLPSLSTFTESGIWHFVHCAELYTRDITHDYIDTPHLSFQLAISDLSLPTFKSTVFTRCAPCRLSQTPFLVSYSYLEAVTGSRDECCGRSL